MEFNSIKATPDIKSLMLTKDMEIMSPEGVEEKIVMACQHIMTLTQGSKYRIYAMGRCGHVHNMGVFDTEKAALEHIGLTMNLEGAMILEPMMMRELMMSKLSRKPRED